MKILKSRILLVIVTIILTGSISVYAARRYYASQIDYEPENSNFNVDNMSDALDELYDKTKNYKNLSTPTDVEANYLLNGKKAYKSNGTLVTGSIPIITAENKTLASGENYTIPQGYHDGTGTVAAPASEYTLTEISNGIKSSNQVFSTYVTNIPGWQNFTVDNFAMVNVTLYMRESWANPEDINVNGHDSPSNLISYNKNTGQVTVAKSSWITRDGHVAYAYKLVCIH